MVRSLWSVPIFPLVCSLSREGAGVMGGKSRKAKAYHTRQHLTQQRLKDGIESLNELFGSETSSDYFTSDMTQEQIVATDHLNSCVCESPPPQPLMQPDAALAMLLHSNSVYKSDDLCAVRSDLAPYDCAKLSCPQNADFLMDVAESLSAPDSRLISGSGEHLLLTDTQYADKVDLDGKNQALYVSVTSQAGRLCHFHCSDHAGWNVGSGKGESGAVNALLCEEEK